MARFLFIVLVLAVVIGGGVWYIQNDAPSVTPLNGTDPKNITYSINGSPVTLVDGSAQTPAAPGSASTIVTQYFGNQATGDISGDDKPDVAFLLTQSDGGSGTFYYVVAAVKTDSGYQGTNAILLGDRIAPQSSLIENGELVVNYADHKPSDPMTAQPSVGMSKFLTVSNGQLVEVK